MADDKKLPHTTALRFSNPSVEMLLRTVNSLEQSARNLFLTSGQEGDAESWHKIRNVKENVDSWVTSLQGGEKKVMGRK